MTEDQKRRAIHELIERYTEEATATPESARAALIKEGIYTASGKLRPEYGGPKTQRR